METLAILTATRYALLKHQGQQRQGANEGQFVPYMVHPIEVATILVECGIKNPTVLQAALLHDVLEDTDVNLMTLRKKFGDEVTKIVEELTDAPGLKGAERKEAQLKRAPLLSWEASAIKVADKTSNLRDLLRLTPNWKPESFGKYALSAGSLVSIISRHQVQGIPTRLFETFWNAHKDAMEFVDRLEARRNKAAASGKRT